MIDPDVQAACEECGFEIIPPNVVPKLGQTRAPATLRYIKQKHGKDDMRFILQTLAETRNNKAMLDEIAFWVVADMLRAFRKNFPAVMEHDVERWYQFWDGLPFAQLQYWCLDLEGITSKRRALNGMVWERAIRQFGPMAAQPDLYDDRRKTA